jgi:hypothetical protein
MCKDVYIMCKKRRRGIARDSVIEWSHYRLLNGRWQCDNGKMLPTLNIGK